MCSSFALIIDSNICFREFLVKRWSLKQQRFEELFNVGTTYSLGSNTKKQKQKTNTEGKKVFLVPLPGDF